MALESGTRIGDYEVLAPLGTGGMSEVYRARDLTLGRDVAIKVLPDDVAGDPERLARLEREAKLLAALSHPNIAVLHGLERASQRSFLVLELVPGRTLEERIRSGPLPFAEARAVFLQVARALEAAHERGIIHRDLKPANVKIAETGAVKLLDFGLGKEVVLAPSRGGKTATYDRRGTSAGTVMGTPAYMSPEQARGLELEKTTDIWSFGLCLFEALTGRNPFERSTLPDTHAAILNDEPPWESLPRELPYGVEVLLRRCLRKDRHDRLHDIGDARLELEEASTASGRTVRGRRRLAASALAALALFVLGWWAHSTREGPSPPPRVERYSIELPAIAPLSLDQGGAIALSPDGSRLVYAARTQGRGQLYVRPLDEAGPVPLPGSEGASQPFFAPAGDRLGFFADGKLRTLALAGGNPATLADAPTPRGGAWVELGGEPRIVFAPGSAGGLQTLVDGRGVAAPLTSPGEGASDRGHRWPAALPGGEGLLLTVWTGARFDVAALAADSGEIQRLVEDASFARFAATGSPGHLVFARGTDLYAAPFDARRRRLLAEPSLVLAGVAFDARTGASYFEISPEGTLFYASDDATIAGGRATLLLVDARGGARPLGESEPSIQVPRLSPDGRRLAMTILDAGASDVWVLDLDRGSRSRLTFGGSSGAAVWSPDGRSLYFASDRAGPHSIYRVASDGSGEPQRLTRAEHPQFPTSVSPDGQSLLYSELDPETSFDLWQLTLSTGERRPLLRTEFEEASGAFSPDGRFIAYASTASGTEQVYVRTSAGPERRWPISARGGAEPVWSRDGAKLYFRSGDALMEVRVNGGSGLEASAPKALFEAPFDAAGVLYANYDVTPDGADFVMIASEQERTSPRIQVVAGWFAELRRRAPETR